MNEDLTQTIEFMLDNMALFKRQVELNAVLTRIAYESLQQAGFTEVQAMAFINSRGPLLA